MAFNVFKEFNNSKRESRKSEIRVRSFSHKGLLFYAAIKGLVIFLSRGVRVSYYTPLKFNKVSPPSPMDAHTICLIDGTMLNCVLAFYTSEYLISFSRCSTILSLPLHRPSYRCKSIWIMVATVTTIGTRTKST